MVQKGTELMLEIFYIIFDRRHVKDVRVWVLLILTIALGAYHRYYVEPRFERQGKKIKAIIEVGHFKAKIDALQKEENRRPL